MSVLEISWLRVTRAPEYRSSLPLVGSEVITTDFKAFGGTSFGSKAAGVAGWKSAERNRYVVSSTTVMVGLGATGGSFTGLMLKLKALGVGSMLMPPLAGEPVSMTWKLIVALMKGVNVIVLSSARGTIT